MAFFKKSKPAEDDVSFLLMQGHDMVEQTGAAHHAEWGLGTADRWDVDPARGVIRWTFPDRSAEAPVQIIGSHHAERGEWVWAWALDAVPPALRRDAETARAFGERTGTAFLTEPQLPVDQAGAEDVVALAFRVCEATGFYRGPGASSTYFTFGDVTLTGADGTTRTFAIRPE